MNGKQLLPHSGSALLIENFLNKEQELKWRKKILDGTPWTQENITLFGRTLPQPRLIAWYGDDGAHYSYSNTHLKPLPWTEDLKKLKELVEKESQKMFNSVLINLYRDGEDSNGWHSDDEKELGAEPVIASLSLGEPRDFIFRFKENHKEQIKVLLQPGSLLVMSGLTQESWQHSLPKRKRVQEFRINLTWREVEIKN